MRRLEKRNIRPLRLLIIYSLLVFWPSAAYAEFTLWDVESFNFGVSEDADYFPVICDGGDSISSQLMAESQGCWTYGEKFNSGVADSAENIADEARGVKAFFNFVKSLIPSAELFISFLKIVLAIFSFYFVVFLGRKVWLIVFQKAIVKRMDELEEVKARVLEKSMGTHLSYFENIHSSGFNYFDSSSLKRFESFFREIKNASSGGHRNLSTVSYLAWEIFRDIPEDLVYEFSDGKAYCKGVPLHAFHVIAYNMLSLIVTYASKSMYLPNKIKLNKITYTRKAYHKYIGIESVKSAGGLERGLSRSSLSPAAVDFFFNVLKFEMINNNSYFYRRFFDCLDDNLIFYTYFLEEGIFAPLELSSRTQYVKLVAVEKINDKDGRVFYSLHYYSYRRGFFTGDESLKVRAKEVFGNECFVEGFSNFGNVEKNEILLPVENVSSLRLKSDFKEKWKMIWSLVRNKDNGVMKTVVLIVFSLMLRRFKFLFSNK